MGREGRGLPSWHVLCQEAPQPCGLCGMPQGAILPQGSSSHLSPRPLLSGDRHRSPCGTPLRQSICNGKTKALLWGLPWGTPLNAVFRPVTWRCLPMAAISNRLLVSSVWRAQGHRCQVWVMLRHCVEAAPYYTSWVSWCNPSGWLSPAQPLAHSPLVRLGKELGRWK